MYFLKISEVILATKALVAGRESKTVGEMFELLATIEWHSSTINGSTDHSIAKIYDNIFS